MKIPSIILSLCLVGVAHAQTLVPAPEPADIPESLLGEGFEDPFATTDDTAVDADDEKGGEKEPGERPDIQPTPDEGISIQVEKPATSKEDTSVPSGEVKIYSPWPAKPMFPAPEGWKFAPAPEGMIPYRTEATLSTGQQVSLAITPFVLVPITDGETSIRIIEPGYKPELGYVQKDTVGVMLQKSNADLEQNEHEVAGSIRRLQQLLSSLPKPTAGGPVSPAGTAASKP